MRWARPPPAARPGARCHGRLLRRAASPDTRAEMPHPLWTRHLGETGAGEAGFGTAHLVQPIRLDRSPRDVDPLPHAVSGS